MAELTQSASIDQASLEEVAEAISELQAYRERLVSETMAAAKKAKVMKGQAQTNLDPILVKIDAMLAELHQRQAALNAEN